MLIEYGVINRMTFIFLRTVGLLTGLISVSRVNGYIAHTNAGIEMIGEAQGWHVIRSSQQAS